MVELAEPQAHPPEVSRHKCLIYDGRPSEQLAVVIPLLRDGLADGWRCLFLGDPDMVRSVGAALGEAGVDVARETARGALILSSDRSHLKDGRFDPQAMIDQLRGTIDQAVADGFKGLCASGDMTWELGADPNFDRLLEYEALLEALFREAPLMGICQYRRNLVPPKAVRDALTAHRSVYVGAELNRDNLFYVPPDLLLLGSRDDAEAKMGRWMCDQIERVLRAERERDDAMSQLAESNRGLEARIEERTAELREANRELEAFSYSVSHDLRAPLRAIGGYARMLVEDYVGALDAEGKRYLDQVLSSTKRMEDLIERLLEFSRTGRTALRPEPVDLTDLARSVVDELLASRPEAKVAVTIHPLPRATVDRALFRQVFANLIGNAIKFSARRERPEVEIGCRTEGAETVCWVKDNGAGFDMRYASRLFGVFQRLHGQSEFEGTGVGLALVQRILHRHGGRIWAEGAVDRGATFSFTLPPGGDAV